MNICVFTGRHECDFRIPDMDMYTRNKGQPQCLEELKSYLEASYTCIRGKSQYYTLYCQTFK